MALNDIYNFEAPTDWLGTSGQPRAEQFADIAAAGYSAVINLAMPTSDNAIPEEGSIVTGHGMSYHQIPVDFAAPTTSDLRRFFGVLKALEGEKVWVHCVINARVSAFSYHYLRMEKGLDEEAASTNLLKRWRPQMDEVWTEFLQLEKSDLNPS